LQWELTLLVLKCCGIILLSSPVRLCLLTGTTAIMRLPVIKFGFEPTSAVDPFRDLLFPLAMEHPAPFHALLAESAFHHATLQGRELPPEGFVHKSRALGMINRALSSRQYGDGVLAAVLYITGLEVSYIWQ
jgi:hypothetical protein